MPLGMGADLTRLMGGIYVLAYAWFANLVRV